MKKTEYRITIRPHRRGHEMKIGYQTFCYGDSEPEMEAMKGDLLDYLHNPKLVREKYPESDDEAIATEVDMPGPTTAR